MSRSSLLIRAQDSLHSQCKRFPLPFGYVFSALIASIAFVEPFVATFVGPVSPCNRDKGLDKGCDKVAAGKERERAGAKQIPLRKGRGQGEGLRKTGRLSALFPLPPALSPSGTCFEERMPSACSFRRLAENLVPHAFTSETRKCEERESGGSPDSARGPRALPGVPGGTLKRYRLGGGEGEPFVPGFNCRPSHGLLSKAARVPNIERRSVICLWQVLRKPGALQWNATRPE